MPIIDVLSLIHQILSSPLFKLLLPLTFEANIISYGKQTEEWWTPSFSLTSPYMPGPSQMEYVRGLVQMVWVCVCFKKRKRITCSIYHRKGYLFLGFKGVYATFSSRSELLGIKMWLRLVWEAF